MLKSVINFVWLSDKHVENQDNLICIYLCVNKDACSLCSVVFYEPPPMKSKNIQHCKIFIKYLDKNKWKILFMNITIHITIHEL